MGRHALCRLILPGGPVSAGDTRHKCDKDRRRGLGHRPSQLGLSLHLRKNNCSRQYHRVYVPFRICALQHLAVLLRRLDHGPVAAPECSQQLLYPDRSARCVPWQGLHSALLTRTVSTTEGCVQSEMGYLSEGFGNTKVVACTTGTSWPPPPTDSAIPVLMVPSATPRAPASACSAPQATPALSVAVSPPTPR